ncbi:MAG: sulfatase [Natronomonas sp.]
MESNTPVSNVVLVTVDSLRADAIGPYDDERHTPVLDSLADRGTVFENAFATGNWTPFSFPSILSSRPVFADTGDIGVEPANSLATVLSEAGVATGGFNAANGFLTSHWNYDSGFDEFDPFVADIGSSIYSQYLASHPTVEAWLQLATSPFRRAASWLRGGTDDKPFLNTSRMADIEGAAESFIEGTESPFFLWVHYMDTHTPYVPAPRYIREVSGDTVGTHRMLLAHAQTGLGREVSDRTLESLRMLYQGATRQVDASIGRLLEALDTAGVADETALVVAGDHGEEFQEHGHLAHYPKLYDELIRVPLLVDVPGAEPRRVERQVALDSVPPTIADLLDAEAPPAWAGETLVPTVTSGVDPADDPVVSVTVRGEDVTDQPIPRALDDGELLVSVRDETWTYIENVDAGGTELYHRPSDPTQQDDLSAEPTDEQRSVIERFEPLATAHAAMLRGAEPQQQEEVDEDLKTRLEALGYR